jgi:hypothetical protein
MNKYIISLVVVATIVILLFLFAPRSKISAINSGCQSAQELSLGIKEFILDYKPSMQPKLREAFSEEVNGQNRLLPSYNVWSEVLGSIDKDIIEKSAIRIEERNVYQKTCYYDFDGNEITKDDWSRLLQDTTDKLEKESGFDKLDAEVVQRIFDNKPISDSTYLKWTQEEKRIDNLALEKMPKEKTIYEKQTFANFYRPDGQSEKPYLSVKIEKSDGKYYLSREGIPILEDIK